MEVPMCAVVEVQNGRLVLYCGTERTEILVPDLTGYTDAYFLASQLKAETEEKAKEEHKKAGGRGGGIGNGNTLPTWRLKQKYPVILALEKVLDCEDFVQACRTANPAQFQDMECDSSAAASATVTPLTAAPKAPKPKPSALQTVLAKLQELEDFAVNVRKDGIGDAVERKVREIQASCEASGVDEWNPHFYRRVVHACLKVHEQKGAAWKLASTVALSALLPSFAHIKLHKLRPEQLLYVDYEIGLTTLHNMMRRAKTEPLDFNLEALQEVFSEAAEGGEGRRPRASVGAQLLFFRFLPEEVQKLPDILIWAARTWPGAIELTDDPQLVERAIEANPNALVYADEAYHKDLYWLQYVLTKKPDFDLQLLKGGGEVVSEILQGARNFSVPVADYALSRPRQILTISYLELAENEPECVNLCVSNVGGLAWGRDERGELINVPVNFGWRTTHGFREWLRNYWQEPIYDWAIITLDGKEGKMFDEVPLIDFDLPKWAALKHLKKTIRNNLNFSAKMKARNNQNKHAQDGQDEGKDGDNTA